MCGEQLCSIDLGKDIDHSSSLALHATDALEHPDREARQTRIRDPIRHTVDCDRAIGRDRIPQLDPGLCIERSTPRVSSSSRSLGSTR